ncbi:hypothetical protein LX36DRAFT_657146 [Colletotrichum falcatum]|nr:hypothetical protein LX36DRAFT_657146 [Colletotrichum falcatum]
MFRRASPTARSWCSSQTCSFAPSLLGISYASHHGYDLLDPSNQTRCAGPCLSRALGQSGQSNHPHRMPRYVSNHAAVRSS